MIETGVGKGNSRLNRLIGTVDKDAEREFELERLGSIKSFERVFMNEVQDNELGESSFGECLSDRRRDDGSDERDPRRLTRSNSRKKHRIAPLPRGDHIPEHLDDRRNEYRTSEPIMISDEYLGSNLNLLEEQSRSFPRTFSQDIDQYREEP